MDRRSFHRRANANSRTARRNPCRRTASAQTPHTLVKNVAVAIAGTVSNAITATHTTLVKNVAVAVAGSVSDAITATNATLVKNVAVAVAGTVSDAITATNATLIKNVAVAVAGTVSDAIAVANTALVKRADAIIDVVANTIRIGIRLARATANARRVFLGT